jgi:hypothetical protein
MSTRAYVLMYVGTSVLWGFASTPNDILLRTCRHMRAWMLTKARFIARVHIVHAFCIHS